MTAGEIMDFRRDNIATKLAITPGSIPSLLVLNCLVPIPIQDNQISVLSWALSDNMQSAAVVINPVFTYTKGKLHVEEQKLVDLLAKGNHNLDWQFSILFREKSDDRDLRPMVYPGRFVFPSPLQDPKKNLFFTCELRKSHRTEEVKQLTANGMTTNVVTSNMISRLPGNSAAFEIPCRTYRSTPKTIALRSCSTRSAPCSAS